METNKAKALYSIVVEKQRYKNRKQQKKLKQNLREREREYCYRKRQELAMYCIGKYTKRM